MTPAEVCDPVLDETDVDYKYNCAYYQLADAMRACMTDNILQYIYTEQLDKINNMPEDLEQAVVYYEDLFVEFPTLETSLNTYLAATTYTGLTYEFNDFSSIETAFVWQGELESPAVWIPNIELLPPNFTASTSNYIIAAPIQIDIEDFDSEDRIFAWEYIGGEMSTISIGETASKNIAQGIVAERLTVAPTVVSSGARKKGFLWIPPPPSPWVPTNGYIVPATGHAKINRIRIKQRYDRNRNSEVRFTGIAGDVNGVTNRTLIEHVKNVHKDDIDTDIWITPVQVCPYITQFSTEGYIFNMYEYDWYGAKYYVGGIKASAGGWHGKAWMLGTHMSDYYLLHRDDNHNYNPMARLDNRVCYNIHTNGSILQVGSGAGSTALLSAY